MLISNGRCILTDLPWVADSYFPNISINLELEGSALSEQAIIQPLSVWKKKCGQTTVVACHSFTVCKSFSDSAAIAINQLLTANKLTPMCNRYLCTPNDDKFFLHNISNGVFCCLVHFPLYQHNDVLLSALVSCDKRRRNGSRLLNQLESLLPETATIYAFTENEENHRFYQANNFNLNSSFKAAYLRKR